VSIKLVGILIINSLLVLPVAAGVLFQENFLIIPAARHYKRRIDDRRLISRILGMPRRYDRAFCRGLLRLIPRFHIT